MIFMHIETGDIYEYLTIDIEADRCSRDLSYRRYYHSDQESSREDYAVDDEFKNNLVYIGWL